MKHLGALLLLLFSLGGCSTGEGDLVVISKEIRREALSQSVAGDQFGSAAGSAIENVVVGQLQNKGTDEARDVEVTFHVSGGGQNYVLTARIPSIPAGKTVDFRTQGIRTPYTLQFKKEGEVEIAVGKKE
jgi:hypothetical protein